MVKDKNEFLVTMAGPRVAEGGDGFQICRVAMNGYTE